MKIDTLKIYGIIKQQTVNGIRYAAKHMPPPPYTTKKSATTGLTTIELVEMIIKNSL